VRSLSTLLKRHPILWIGPLLWFALALAALLYQVTREDAPFTYSLF